MKKINFDRKDLFKHYNDMDNPFIIMTVPIDVTKVVNFCKKYKHFYATFGYIVGNAINDVIAFKYRYVDGDFYYTDRLLVNFTERVEDNLGFFNCESEDYEEFVTEFDLKKSKLAQYKLENENRQDVVWVSCFPWASFNGLISPHDKSLTIPQIIWDKYQEIDGKYTMNVMIMVHHGFADGYHVGQFIERLNYYISEFEE